MISVILCGGAGSRLWPLSRDLHPKPFLPLPSGRSLLEESYFRAAALPQTAGIITVTGRDLYFKAAETWQRAALSISHNYILEPVGRNTAPAIIAAALETIRLHGSETPMLILAADHIITDQAALAEAVSRALELAAQDFLVTFGLRPARPDTGFGYIEASGDRALRFVEKPDEETARRYLAAGNFYWNAGLFCFKAGTLLEEMKNLAPELLSATEAAMADAKNGALYLKAGAFSAVPNISIDYALMEKSDKVAVVACDPGWSDVGSWSVLAALHGSDDHGNHILGGAKTILEDVRNCDFHGQDRLIAALGLDNLLVIDTPDALLVADRKREQDVKGIYNRLKAEGGELHSQHRTTHRPWGSYTILGEGPRFKIKRLEIKPGAAMSMQLHHHRNEHWIVVSGMAEVIRDGELFLLDTNESTYIKAGHQHRVANRGLIDLLIIEVQSGDYLGEDDIVRFDDIYGRVQADGDEKG